MKARRKYYQTKAITKRTKSQEDIGLLICCFLLTIKIKRLTKITLDFVMLTRDQIKTGKMLVKKNI